ncbi:MAG: hypothetical protein OXI22_09490 [Defluviicoccus sp.]|nr:hypothetical protein [Defluviicoccus sp.]MDE0384106.1 hypothetical protein [Defluviicoccus sp.]
MPADLVRLDLARFTARDLEKVAALARKLELMHRWYRSERIPGGEVDEIRVYSGDRGNAPYACYRISRRADGSYCLADHRSGREIARARSIDPVIEAIPGDFFYAGARRKG